jgi:hypothetical protein
VSTAVAERRDVGFAEPGDLSGGGRELHALTGKAGADSEGGGDVCLAGAGRAEEARFLGHART